MFVSGELWGDYGWWSGGDGGVMSMIGGNNENKNNI